MAADRGPAGAEAASIDSVLPGIACFNGSWAEPRWNQQAMAAGPLIEMGGPDGFGVITDRVVRATGVGSTTTLDSCGGGIYTRCPTMSFGARTRGGCDCWCQFGQMPGATARQTGADQEGASALADLDPGGRAG